MRITEIEDVARFASRVRGPLGRDEEHNALALGLLGQLERGLYDRRRLVVMGTEEPTGCGIRTDDRPWHVVTFDHAHAESVGANFGRWLGRAEPGGTSLMGGLHVADAAASALAGVMGAPAEVTMRFRRMTCREVTWRPHPPGAAQRAVPADVDDLLGWIVDFQTESLGHEPTDVLGWRQRVLDDLQAGTSPFWWWVVDGDPVCLAGIGRPTGSGERVGPVYTPPPLRGRGFAGALVAAMTADALDRGCAWVGLYTDASNPISNRLYAKLGYVDIGDAVEWRVDGGAAAG